MNQTAERIRKSDKEIVVKNSCKGTDFPVCKKNYYNVTSKNNISMNMHSAERCISPPPPLFLFHPPFLVSPLFLRNMHPSPLLTLITGFYDDTPESRRLETINIKPWKPNTFRNCVS